jgi:hypothetical protein
LKVSFKPRAKRHLFGGGSFGDTFGDRFEFQKQDTGDVYAGQADTIYDFTDADQIYLKDSYSYAGASSKPADGQYSIWWKEDMSSWIVRYNNTTDIGYHDIVVKNGDPHGDISFF